jgi:hypothetical protein
MWNPPSTKANNLSKRDTATSNFASQCDGVLKYPLFDAGNEAVQPLDAPGHSLLARTGAGPVTRSSLRSTTLVTNKNISNWDPSCSSPD